MRIKGWITIFLLIIIGAGWAEYEIEVLSETTFQDFTMSSSIKISECNNKLYFYKNNLYCIDDDDLGIVTGLPDSCTIFNSTSLTTYNGKLYCIDQTDKHQFISYDGTEFNPIANISKDDYGIYSDPAPMVCNGKLYFGYKTTTEYTACYDGENISLIEEYGYSGRAVYNNKLYYSDENYQVKSYNGESSASITSPDNANIALLGSALEYNGKLYFKYSCDDSRTRLAVYDDSDGSQAITFINNTSCNGRGIASGFFLCVNKLYYYSCNTEDDDSGTLTCYDTYSESFINITQPDYAISDWNTYIFNDGLYCSIEDAENHYKFIHLNGTSFNLVEESLLFNSFGSFIITYDNKLFFKGTYDDGGESYSNCCYFDGTEIVPIESSIGTKEFSSVAFAHFDKLYLVYYVSSAGFMQGNYCFATCQYVEDDPMPVELSSFNCSLCDGIPLLQWTTMSEINNAGWNIYRGASDGQQEAMQVNCELIDGHGTTSQLSQYSFYDQYSLQTNSTYYYWLESIDYSGNSEKFGPIALFIPEENEETPEVPSISALKSNSPNPFNPTTTIFYDIAIAGNVELNVYNAKGQFVETLVNEYKEADYYNVIWQADNQPSGVYYYQLKSKFYNETHKMLLLK